MAAFSQVHTEGDFQMIKVSKHVSPRPLMLDGICILFCVHVPAAGQPGSTGGCAVGGIPGGKSC